LALLILYDLGPLGNTVHQSFELVEIARPVQLDLIHALLELPVGLFELGETT
jgi:hypothetical protein